MVEARHIQRENETVFAHEIESNLSNKEQSTC